MSDMADFSIDNSFNEIYYYEKYSDAPLQVQYDEGLIDELGVTIGAPWSVPLISNFTPSKKGAHGVGACPKCGGETARKSGQYGDFYGCKAFPECKGSRST